MRLRKRTQEAEPAPDVEHASRPDVRDDAFGDGGVEREPRAVARVGVAAHSVPVVKRIERSGITIEIVDQVIEPGRFRS